MYSGAGYYVIKKSKGKYVCEECVDLIMSYLITCYAIQNNKVNNYEYADR